MDELITVLLVILTAIVGIIIGTAFGKSDAIYNVKHNHVMKHVPLVISSGRGNKNETN